MTAEKSNYIEPHEVIRPEFRMDWPIWWNRHGLHMRVAELSLDPPKLVIKGSTAELNVSRYKYPNSDKQRWSLDWLVVQNYPNREEVRGRVIVNSQCLSAAFGLEDLYVRGGKFGSKWLVDRYGASAASQKEFIRFENFLNIPCPGTGNDGDPNISIFVDDDMKDAVGKLLASGKNEIVGVSKKAVGEREDLTRPPAPSRWPTAEELREAAAQEEDPRETMRKLRQRAPLGFPEGTIENLWYSPRTGHIGFGPTYGEHSFKGRPIDE